MWAFLGATLAVVFLGVSTRADYKDAKADVDKAINALGGAEKIGKVDAFSWKGKAVPDQRNQRIQGPR